MFKKILAALLAIISVATFAACASDTADNGNAETTSSSDTTVADASVEPTDADRLAQVVASLPDVDYDGFAFRVLDRENETWGTVDVFSEAENGEPINDAVYQRNSIIEENLNIKIEELRRTHNQVSAEAAKLILANEDAFETLNDGLRYQTTTLIVPGYLVDLKTIDELDLSADHWDPMIEDGLSIANKLYYSTGDISIMDNYGTWCVLFNKQLIEDLALDDPYTLVNDGTWTITKLTEMANAASLDLNGDGVMTDGDQWGFLTERFNAYALWVGSGEKVVTKNADDIPELTVYNERSVNVMEKVLDLQLNTNVAMSSEKRSEGAAGTKATFTTGKGLFMFCGLRNVSAMRDSEFDFGIIPNAKYDEAQDGYKNAYSWTNFTVYGVPITNSDLSRTGTILEAMAAVSKYTLTPAYYDITLEGKFLRDDESSEMIDIILATRNFDLGSLFDWGGSMSMLLNMYDSGSYDMASAYARIESNAIKAIDDFVTKISE